ncbi:MAG: hypothetical protein KC656_11300 [Myxococcales bacterium]|nr:hypothetical protein [Myxococcales bacterium]
MSIFDVSVPMTILGRDVGVDCAEFHEDVTIVLDGGSTTLMDLGLTLPTVHASDSTTATGLPPATRHPTIDFGTIFDGCP